MSFCALDLAWKMRGLAEGPVPLQPTFCPGKKWSWGLAQAAWLEPQPCRAPALCACAPRRSGKMGTDVGL